MAEEKGDGRTFGRSARREEEERQVELAIARATNERVPRLARKDAFVPPVELNPFHDGDIRGSGDIIEM